MRGGGVVFPLDRHFRGDLFLFRNSLGQLGEVLRFVASLGEVLQNLTANTPSVLKASTLNVMREVLRGGVVQVVQVAPLVFLVGGIVPHHLDRVPH